MKNLIIIIFVFYTLIFPQSIDDSFYLIKYSEFNNINDYHLNFGYFDSDLIQNNIEFKLSIYNSIVNYNQQFKDNNFLVFYNLANSINDKINFELSTYIENSKVQPVLNYSEYYNDEFNKFSGDINKAYLDYEYDNIALKIGRDYFLPGKYLYDRLLFSSNGHPYDQLVFTFIKNKVSISSFYLQLNSFEEANVIYNRHLNGHRININLNNGYLALNEICIYGGENQNIHFPLLNPFNNIYIYQMNNKFNLNSILSLEYFFENDKHSFFMEFVLDDFQIDKKEPADLEPTEFAFLIDFSKSIGSSLKYNFNYTIISNRTFNAPNNNYEKMIYKNFPIGHNLGNNFWKIENGLLLSNPKSIFYLRYIYIKKGDEALFSDFNMDYLDYDISEGYKEKFPFGNISAMSGLVIDYHFLKNKKFNFNSSISYWFQSYLENSGFNFSVSAKYLFEL